MRILYISNSTSTSGAPAALFNLVKEMKSRGNEIAVVVPNDKGSQYGALLDLGIRCYSSMYYTLTIWPLGVINPFKFIRRIRLARANKTKVRSYIGSVIDDFKPDIVHTNVGPLDIAFEECRKRGIPHVWHLREYQDLDFGMKFYPSKNDFKRQIYSQGNYLISITEDIARHWNISDRCRVIYDGVFNPETDIVDIHPPANYSNYFLYVGRIERSKGLLSLLRAYRKYRKRQGKCRLLIAGRPCGLYALICRIYVWFNGLGDATDFLGQRNDVYSLMSGAMAFIMPSRHEGFGFTTAESMLNNCLVIGRDTAGTKEQFDNGLKDTGEEIALRFKTVEELTIRMIEVSNNLEPEKYERIKTLAGEVVRQRYSSTIYSSEIEKFYNEII